MTVWRSLVSATVAMAIAVPAGADTIHVPEDYQTIQEGIDAAVDGDRVPRSDRAAVGGWTSMRRQGSCFKDWSMRFRTDVLAV